MRYRVKVGINYRPDGQRAEVRHEPGDVVDDLPARADVQSLLEQGVIEPADDVQPSAQPAPAGGEE